jgi:iron complex transport system substrate-binding protein
MMKRLTYFLSAVLVAAMFAATACGGGDDDSAAGDVATPQATQAATATTAPTAAAAATTAPTQAAQRRTFTDATGKPFDIPTAPKRVVALSPSVVDVMYAVGAPPVARPSSANYPEQAKSLPEIGTSYQPNLELIAAQNPDFIIADAQIQNAQTIANLAKLAPVFAIRVQSLADVSSSLRLVGGVMGKAEEGEKAAKQLETQLQTLQSKLPPESERPKVFVMVGTADAFWGAKPDSFAGDVVAKLGAKNLVQSGPDTAPFPGFVTYSLEQIAALDPDAIFVISPAPNAPPTSRLLAGNPAWSGWPARREEQPRPGTVDRGLPAGGGAAREPGDGQDLPLPLSRPLTCGRAE